MFLLSDIISDTNYYESAEIMNCNNNGSQISYTCTLSLTTTFTSIATIVIYRRCIWFICYNKYLFNVCINNPSIIK